MFDNLGWPEVVVLIIVGLFIFGPDKLPKAVSDGLRFLRNVRAMARNATSDLSRELGTDLELEDLNPRTFIRKHVLSDEDQALLRGHVEDLRGEITSAVSEPFAEPAVTAEPVKANGHRPRFDADAT